MAFSDDDIAGLYALDLFDASVKSTNKTRVSFHELQSGFGLSYRTGNPRGRPKGIPYIGRKRGRKPTGRNLLLCVDCSCPTKGRFRCLKCYRARRARIIPDPLPCVICRTPVAPRLSCIGQYYRPKCCSKRCKSLHLANCARLVHPRQKAEAALRNSQRPWRACPQCGTEFQVTKDRENFCSKQCVGRHNLERVRRRVGGNAAFCWKMWRAIRHTAAKHRIAWCAQCSATFAHKQGQRYCSRRCVNAAMRAAHVWKKNKAPLFDQCPLCGGKTSLAVFCSKACTRRMRKYQPLWSGIADRELRKEIIGICCRLKSVNVVLNNLNQMGAQNGLRSEEDSSVYAQ
jgi:hypothetical protein